MKIKIPQKRDLTKWHSWFAWHPVRVGPDDCRWLEVVWRKGTLESYAKLCDISGYAFEETYWDYEYRA